jgi:hypothetical protein
METPTRLVVLGDPARQLLARLAMGLVDHVERSGQQIGMSRYLRAQPTPGLGDAGLHHRSDLGGVEEFVGSSEFRERGWVHETLDSGGSQDAILEIFIMGLPKLK